MERNVLKEPLSVAELEELARRVGSIRELVKPTARLHVEGLDDASVTRFLSENPNSVRRPIIDTGARVTLGFTPAVREQLGGGAPKATAAASRPRAARRKPSMKVNRRGR